MRRFAAVVCLAAAMCAVAGADARTARREPRTPHFALRDRLLVIVANRLCLADLDDPALPTISNMLREGAVGLVSPNCLGPKSDYSVLLTASAGASCGADDYVRDSYDASETVNGELASDAYRVRTGCRARPGNAVFLGLGQAQRELEEKGLSVTPGVCGDAIRAAGGKTCAIGNADRLPDWFDRSAAVLAMDSRGLIDVGRLAVTPYSWDHSGPNCAAGITSPSFDIDRPEEMIPACAERADYVVIYYGDTVRLDETKISIADAAFEVHKGKALRNLDALISALIHLPDSKRVTLMLISFSPPSDGLWDRLTPVVVYPADRPGLLTSPTTRTPGLIAASDYAPTVLGLMRVKPTAAMVGRPAHSVGRGSDLATLYELERRVAANRLLILPVCWVFALIGAASLAAGALVAGFDIRATRLIVGLIRAGLLLCAAAPAAMLLAVLFPAGVVGYSLGVLASLAAVMVIVGGRAFWIARKSLRPESPWTTIYALTVAIVFADALTGGTLCKFSLPSSYQLSGMRYYGIGNEYAGLLIAMAAALLAFVGRGRWAAIPLGGAIVVLLGVGSLGANSGAAVAAVMTFGLIVVALSRGGFGARHVAAVFVLAVVLVAAFAYADLMISGVAAAHAGQATGLAEKLGQGYLVSLVSRKTLLNFNLLASATAQKAFLAFVPFIVLWFFRLRDKAAAVFKERPETGAALNAAIVGAVFAFLFNDSGVVFAGIMLSMVALPVVYVIMEYGRCRES